MRQKIVHLLTVAAAFAALAVAPAFAQEEWQSITDDVSRSELFATGIRPGAEPMDPSQQSFALNGPFVFPYNARIDLGVRRTNSIFGIDVSHHNSADPRCTAPVDPHREIDFGTLRLQEVRFVYVKASQGVGYRDCRFVEYWKSLGELPDHGRVLRGAYHFLSASRDGADQAATYVRLINQNGGFLPTDMPPAVDLEWDKASTDGPDRWTGKTPREIIDSALAWLRAVEAASGRKPVIYTARAWWRERGIPESMFAEFDSYVLWIADYKQSRRAVEAPATPGAARWGMWQFAEDARVQGHGRGLDASIFKGTEEEFIHQMGLED